MIVHQTAEWPAGFGEQVASLALRVFDPVTAARRENEELSELTAHLGRSLNLGEIFSALARRLRAMIPFRAIVLYVPCDEGIHAQFVEGEAGGAFRGITIRKGEGFVGRIASDGEAAVSGDGAADLRASGQPEQPAFPALAAPLEEFGVLVVYGPAGEVFTQDHVRVMAALGPPLAMAVRNALEHDQVGRAAATDALTGLPNSATFHAWARAELDRRRQEARKHPEKGKTLTEVMAYLQGLTGEKP